MKKITTFILSIFLIGVYSVAPANAATIEVSERNCKDSSQNTLLSGLPNYWSGNASILSARENVSNTSCTAADIQVWMAELQTSCTTYFDVVTITPIIKGYSEIVYYNNPLSSSSTAQGRGAGYGYSYTDRLIMVYRCQ